MVKEKIITPRFIHVPTDIPVYFDPDHEEKTYTTGEILQILGIRSLQTLTKIRIAAGERLPAMYAGVRGRESRWTTGQVLKLMAVSDERRRKG